MHSQLTHHPRKNARVPHKVCDAVVISCIDFRFQGVINDWIRQEVEDWGDKHLHKSRYDRVALAGGVFDLDSILKQVEISYSLHSIKRVILINHEDCGAYGAEGTYQRHIKDLKGAIKKIESKFPELKAEGYFLHLDGTFEKV